MNDTINNAAEPVKETKGANAQMNAVVLLSSAVSPWLRIIQVAPIGWQFPDFEPGQYTTIGVYGSTPRYELAEPETVPPDPLKLIRRPYSIVSSPSNKEFVEFYVNLVPTGVFTPRLFSLKIGDPIWLSERVVGHFTFRNVPDDANVVLVANGAGLAPFVSMLSTHLGIATTRRVVLIHGVRHSWDLGYRSVFMAMERLRPNFAYVPVVSRPQEEPVSWKGATGHVQDFWQSGNFEGVCGFQPNPANTHIFLCGSPEMIDGMTALTSVKGFQKLGKDQIGQVHIEQYWPRVTIRDDHLQAQPEATRYQSAAR